MSKFFKSKKNPEIVRAVELDEDGNRKHVIAIIGQAETLLGEGIITPTPGMNERAWVALETSDFVDKLTDPDDPWQELYLEEFSSKKEVKDYIIEKYA